MLTSKLIIGIDPFGISGYSFVLFLLLLFYLG